MQVADRGISKSALSLGVVRALGKLRPGMLEAGMSRMGAGANMLERGMGSIGKRVPGRMTEFQRLTAANPNWKLNSMFRTSHPQGFPNFRPTGLPGSDLPLPPRPMMSPGLPSADTMLPNKFGSVKIANAFSKSFLRGFVEQCQEIGLDCDTTENLFRKHANNSVIATPSIYNGFREVLGSYEGPMAKSALACYLTPDMISIAEDCRIKWGSDILSSQMREAMGFPEPSWDTVPEDIKQAASQLSSSMDSFDHLPLNQKILLAALMGGSAGGAMRGLVPSDEDLYSNRGLMNRVTRGVGRGALTGAGAGVGAGAGGEVVDAFSGPPGVGGRNPAKVPAMLLGGVLGGMGGFKLGE